MRRRAFLALAAVLAACGPAPPQAPGTLPALALPDLAGRSVPLAQDDGRRTLVAFWATWCEPCRRELPALECVHRSRAEAVRVVGVSLDTDINLVREFVADHQVTFPTLLDPRGAQSRDALDVRALPLTLVVDADGGIVERVAGVRDWPAWADGAYGRSPVSVAACGAGS